MDIALQVSKLLNKKKTTLNVGYELRQWESVLKAPSKNETIKIISLGGGSSVSLIAYICKAEKIKELYVSTFRIGIKQFCILNKLHEEGRIESAHFLTSTTQKNTDKDYKYYQFIKDKCRQNDWELKVLNNHSKLILMKTENNFYVVETSSNLNENPKIEQFSFENDEELYYFYKNLFVELLKNGVE